MTRDEIIKKLKQDYDFMPPEWWECQWKRIPCNSPECMLCGKMLKQRFKHEMKGENPDSMESALQDVGDSFAEIKFMIEEMTKEKEVDLDAIDESEIKQPPDHWEHPLFKKTYEWVKKLHQFADRNAHGWHHTEAGQDLMWYANLIPAKTGRNLNNRWLIENDDPDYGIDYDYQHYILSSCISIVQSSFEEIISMHLPYKNELIELYNELIAFKDDVLSI